MVNKQQTRRLPNSLKKNISAYTLIVLGAFLQALSYVVFLAPYKIVPGGVCMVFLS